MTKTIKISDSEGVLLELLRSGMMTSNQYYRETDGSVLEIILLISI